MNKKLHILPARGWNNPLCKHHTRSSSHYYTYGFAV